MSGERNECASVPPEAAGQRLDKALAALFPQYSRSRLQAWIEADAVRVDGRVPGPRERVKGGEQIELRIVETAVLDDAPEAIPLNIVHEDRALLVLDKPTGLVVHPGAGNARGTLLNALLHHAPELAQLPRGGIVHRLDKDTSGLMVVARSLEAHNTLVAALQEREVSREYEAVVCGVMTAGGTVDAPIGRHPSDRVRMAVRGGAREAVTHYRVAERFRRHTHVRLKLETGRTHQIRVHMQHLGFPLVGDPVYGRRLLLPAGATPGLQAALTGFRRQALHAAKLGLTHPLTGEPCAWSVPLPPDFAALLAALRDDTLQCSK